MLERDRALARRTALAVLLIDLEKGLSLLRNELVDLGAPLGTELHYQDAGERLQDELRSTGWVLRRPRTFLYPRFGW